MTRIEHDQVVIVSAPRSGTNFFCECLADLPENLGFFEIFNPRGMFGGRQGDTLPAFGEHLGTRISDVSDAALLEFIRERPIEALNVLGRSIEASGYSSFSYKIFPNQVSPEALGQILHSERCRIILIVRRRLDTYISYAKARERDVWKNESTKDLLPEIDVRDFLRWAKRLDDWYTDATQILRAADRPIDVFAYESDINVPKHELVDRVAGLLQVRGLRVSVPTDRPPVRFRKQDRDVGPFKKVGNEQELRAALRERGRYNYALGTPLAGDD